MKNKLKGAIITAAAIAALALGAAAIAGATGATGPNDDDHTDKPITGQALERAKAVALDHTGSGKVTGTEAGDEEGAYEVEVTRPNGSQVDVHLDQNFNVTNAANDSDKGDASDENERADD